MIYLKQTAEHFKILKDSELKNKYASFVCDLYIAHQGIVDICKKLGLPVPEIEYIDRDEEINHG